MLFIDFLISVILWNDVVLLSNNQFALISRFHSIFARQIPTKGSWGPAAYRGFPSYTPDTMSIATSDSGGQLFKQHRRQYTDAHNSSWFDSSRGAANIDSHPRHYWSSKGTLKLVFKSFYIIYCWYFHSFISKIFFYAFRIDYRVI